MSELTWEWVLPTGEQIVARVDAITIVESVYVGTRLASRSGNGGKPDGHTVALKAAGSQKSYREAAAQDLHVKYDPALSNFVLRYGGQVVTPSRAPNTPSAGTRPGQVYGHISMLPAPFVPALPPPSSSGGVVRIVGGVLAGLILLGAGGAAFRRFMAPRTPEAPAGSIAASNGLLVAHYPAGFKAKEDSRSVSNSAGPGDECGGRICTMNGSTIKIRHVSNDEGVMIISLKTNGLRVGRDIWRVSNLLHSNFESEVKKGLGFEYEEADRQDATCLGEPGAAVTGKLRRGADHGTMWSCTFLRDGNAFWIIHFVNGKHAADEAALKQIVDATELTTK